MIGWGKKPPPKPTRIIRISADLHFGEVKVGSAKWRRIAIHNSGNTDLKITDVLLPAGFTTTLKESIVPKRSVIRGLVYFRPKEERQFLGDIVIHSNQTSGVNRMQISGVGKPRTPAVPAPYIQVTSSVNYGTVTVGSAATRPITIKNAGSEDLVVSRIAVPEGFGTSVLAPFTLKSGQTRTLHVRFAPTREVFYNGTLQIVSNAKNNHSAGSSRLTGRGGALPAGKPDVSIRRSNSGYVGVGRINSNGIGQTIVGRTSHKKKRTKVYYTTIRNRGKATDSFRVHGSKGGSRFGARYYYMSGGRTTDVTNAVTRGTFTVPNVAPSRDSGLLKLEVKPRRKSAKGDTKICTITTRSVRKARKVDVMKATTKVQ